MGAMTSNDERVRGLARLAVRVGANAAVGQDVFVLAFGIARRPSPAPTPTRSARVPVIENDAWMLD